MATTDLPSFSLTLPPRDFDLDVYAHRRRVPAGPRGTCRDASLEMDYVASLDQRQVAVLDVPGIGGGDMSSWLWGGTVSEEERAEELETEGNLKMAE